jgi:uncharacterized membrane protein YkoI
MKMRLIGAAVGIVALATVGTASEKKIQMKDLPPAVRSAVETATKDSTIKALSREVENGKTMYEAETVKNGHSRDLLFDAKGAVVEIEEELALDSAPDPVKSALAARGGKVLTLESVTKGSTVTYEAHVQKNGKRSEVKLDAAGKPVK